jgi:hypothetical protein
LSSIKTLFAEISRLFHVEQLNLHQNITPRNTMGIVSRGTIAIFLNTYTLVINSYSILFPLFIAFFGFLSILWTTNASISIYRSIKFLEYILLYFYIIKIVPRGTMNDNIETKKTTSSKLFHVEQSSEDKPNVPRGTIIKKILQIIIIIGVLQSIIGIIQFCTQKSIGLFILKESLISPEIPGVAKVIFANEPFIRAYGLFPHPNILGGYLVISIIFTILYIKLFHVEQFQNKLVQIVPRGTMLFKLFLYLQIFALIFTFSKSAIAGLLSGLIYILLFSNSSIVPRGTVLSGKSMQIILVALRQKIRLILVFSATLITLLFIIKPNNNALFIQSLKERVTFINISAEIIRAHPFIGIGSGQFIPVASANHALLSWQYQPVHNIFLLFANEYGLILLFGFIFYTYTLIKNTHCSTWNNSFKYDNLITVHLKGILIAFILIMLFDHYLWDIAQGQIMLWTIFALIVSQKTKSTCKQSGII